MLKLAEIENKKLAEIKLIQLAQDAMLPEFEAAADHIRNELRVASSGGLFYNDGYNEQPIACDADRIAEHFLTLHKAKIIDRFETAMKDKRYGSDSAYTKDVEQKLGRSSVF